MCIQGCCSDFSFTCAYFLINWLRTAGLHLKVISISCQNSKCLFECFLNAVSFAFVIFSSNKNGKYYTEPTADDTLTPRPPINEQYEPKPSTSGIGKTGRPWRTVEEVCGWERLSEIKPFSNYSYENTERSFPVLPMSEAASGKHVINLDFMGKKSQTEVVE